jgi:hypothetical protein
MLTQEEKGNILSDFPNIKLSYENDIYKKVYNSDIVVAIPKGTKCFAYFIHNKNKPVCLIMELTNNKQIVDIKIFNACFSNDLAYGTIFYGTLFYTSGNRFFTIEDIFSYKGILIETANWEYKLGLLNQILKKDMKQISYNNSYIVFGLPIIYNTLDELDKRLVNLKYPIDFVQFYTLNQVNKFSSMYYSDYIKNEQESIKEPLIKEPLIKNQVKLIERKNKQKINKEYVFLLRPDIQDDIYYIYAINNDSKEIECGNAHIYDCNTSVMMNKLFRIIKENDNLDALEESDDEEEFENEQLSKFVKLDTSEKMLCKYHYKFKRWIPIKVASATSKIITLDEFETISKYYQQNNKRY